MTGTRRSDDRDVLPSPPAPDPSTGQGHAAYIAAGSIAAAAYELGISETTARQHLSGLYRRTGCLSVAQAAYLLGAGLLTTGPAAVEKR